MKGSDPTMSEFSEKYQLDIDDLEIARSLHRVVRAMHDGECPKCHALFESRSMRLPRNIHDNPLRFDLICPGCQFTVTAKEQDDVIKQFAPVMERNLEVFELWRSER